MAIKKRKKKPFKVSSKLEGKFEVLLRELNIEYVTQYKIAPFAYRYDFYLPKYNTIIEVDGDFWHSNPDTGHPCRTRTQMFNKKRDARKNIICEDAGIKLIRIWESDINTHPDKVRNILESL